MTEQKVIALEKEKSRLLRDLARREKDLARQERSLAQAARERERQEAKTRLLAEMPRHVGKHRAIGMGELYEIVFQAEWRHRINDTRRLRRLLELVKYGPDHMPIAFSCCSIRPGYYIPATDSEWREFMDREEQKVKKKIGRLARLDKKAAGDYAGQLALRIQAEEAGGLT